MRLVYWCQGWCIAAKQVSVNRLPPDRWLCTSFRREILHCQRIKSFLASPGDASFMASFMPDQKTIETRCLGGFAVMWVPKFLLSPVKIRNIGQKRPNLAQNWNFWPNIGIFGPFGLMPDQKTMRTSCLGGFCYVGTKTFTYSHKN